MRGHFKYLNFKKFSMISWGLKLVLVFPFNQGSEYPGLSHECNSQNKNALGSPWVQSLAFSPTCETLFHSQTHSLGLICPCTPHLVVNLMLGLWHKLCMNTFFSKFNHVWRFVFLFQADTIQAIGIPFFHSLNTISVNNRNCEKQNTCYLDGLQKHCMFEVE